MFSIEIKRKALRKLTELDEKRKGKIEEVVTILKADPVPFRRVDICKLKGYDNMYRVRTGDLRIVYEVSWDRRAVVIHYVGPREKAYRGI